MNSFFFVLCIYNFCVLFFCLLIVIRYIYRCEILKDKYRSNFVMYLDLLVFLVIYASKKFSIVCKKVYCWFYCFGQFIYVYDK